MRVMIVCLAFAAAIPLTACATTEDPSRTVAEAPHASDAPMRASRAQATAQMNSAVGRSLAGG